MFYNMNMDLARYFVVKAAINCVKREAHCV
jgi:hypothetical protein